MTLPELERTALAVVAAVLADADLDAVDGPLSLLDGLDRDAVVDVLVAITAVLTHEWEHTAGQLGLSRALLLAAVRQQLAHLAKEPPHDEA